LQFAKNRAIDPIERVKSHESEVFIGARRFPPP
jgi:hypothetical protein